MPKRKKLPKISNYQELTYDSHKLTVQKSNPLMVITDIMPLTELKILDAYLGRINSHQPDKRLVHFEKGELEKILGVTRILKDDLSARIDALYKSVEIPDDSKPNGFSSIGLFEKADCYTDEKGLWQVDIKCTESAMEYIFNLENIGYIRYRLKNVINLTSKYSYVLFLYLLDNIYRKTWSLDLTELKALLNCNAERYKQFKFFNSEVLKKCYKELCEKTNLKYSYKPIKHGKVVYAVEFTVISFDDKLGDQLHSESSEVSNNHEKSCDVDCDSELAIMMDKACKGEFTSKQIFKLHDLVCKAIPEIDTQSRIKYFIEKFDKMEEYDPEKRFKYLRTMIENEIKSQVDDKPSYDLDDYEQYARNYDFSDAPWNQDTDNNSKGE